MTEYISVKQMAEKLNISLDTAYTYTHMANFPAVKIGRIIRIPTDALEKWISKYMLKCS